MISLGLAAWLALINLTTFVIFWRDKRAAIAGRRRVPERSFYVMALIGAGPAILCGAEILRHKTRKQPFRIIVQGILFAQVALAAAWLVLV